MDEQTWRKSEQPEAMLEYLTEEHEVLWETPDGSKGERRGPREKPLISNRKLRLFACACVREVWDEMDERSQQAIEMVERREDGEEVQVAWEEVHDTAYQVGWNDADRAAKDSAFNCRERHGASPKSQACLLREIAGNPFRATTVRDCGCGACDLTEITPDGDAWCRKTGRRADRKPWLTPQATAIASAAYEERRRCQRCKGARHIKAPRPVSNPACAACKGAGHDGSGHRDPDTLAVLADALEEAGCAEQELLRHLRGEELCPECMGTAYVPSRIPMRFWPENTLEVKDACGRCKGTGWSKLREPHVKGCWATDAVLGKS